MKTLDTTSVPAGDLDKVDAFARSSLTPEARDLILSLTESARSGAELTVLGEDEVLTPNQAAEQLKMSRTHLYKLMDKGVLTFHRVGRDRRIYWKDLVAFQEQRLAGRKELAERFAQHDQSRSTGIDRLADQL